MKKKIRNMTLSAGIGPMIWLLGLQACVPTKKPVAAVAGWNVLPIPYSPTPIMEVPHAATLGDFSMLVMTTQGIGIGFSRTGNTVVLWPVGTFKTAAALEPSRQ